MPIPSDYIMQTKEKQNINSEDKSSQIYICVDHLKQGIYQLHLMCKEKIIKTIKFKKL